jgi:hypothetical protein
MLHDVGIIGSGALQGRRTVSTGGHDWRTAKALHQAALDRFCEGSLAECRASIEDEAGTSHGRYHRAASAGP